MSTAVDQMSRMYTKFPKNYHFLPHDTHTFICVFTLYTDLYGILEKYWVMIHF